MTKLKMENYSNFKYYVLDSKKNSLFDIALKFFDIYVHHLI